MNKKWDEESKQHRDVVTADHIADVVSMMSGVPVTELLKLK